MSETAHMLDLIMGSLAPLREGGYLTAANETHRVDGALTVVLSGNTEWTVLKERGRNETGWREVFLDAPLGDALIDSPLRIGERDKQEEGEWKGEKRRDKEGEKEKEEWTNLNAHYASASLVESVGRIRNGSLSEKQQGVVREQVRWAHDRGLRVRYWDVPEWGPGVWDRHDGVWAFLGGVLDMRLRVGDEAGEIGRGEGEGRGGDVVSVDGVEGLAKWWGI
jgi:hypothetical protein